MNNFTIKKEKNPILINLKDLKNVLDNFSENFSNSFISFINKQKINNSTINGNLYLFNIEGENLGFFLPDLSNEEKIYFYNMLVKNSKYGLSRLMSEIINNKNLNIEIIENQRMPKPKTLTYKGFKGINLLAHNDILEKREKYPDRYEFEKKLDTEYFKEIIKLKRQYKLNVKRENYVKPFSLKYLLEMDFSKNLKYYHLMYKVFSFDKYYRGLDFYYIIK